MMMMAMARVHGEAVREDDDDDDGDDDYDGGGGCVGVGDEYDV